MEELQYLHKPESEPIPGYKLLQPLGRGGFGEVWKCEAPGGLLKAIKFVHGGLHVLDQNAPADEELRAIQHVKTIRHPFILSMERVEIVDGELVIVMELADRSLADVLEAEQAQGRMGISRDVLLNYMREAAEVLDVMNGQHGLQHLDIKPRNLFLVSNHVKVGDFGLVNSLAAENAASGLALGAITPLYASPEVFQGSISPQCDQYSLAIVYQEMLTGRLPFNGKNSRQLMLQHVQGSPDVSELPENDRPVIARALSKDPRDRFPSCSDLVHALVSGQTEVVTTFRQESRVRPGDTRPTPVVKTVRIKSVTSQAQGKPTGEKIGGLEVLDLVSRTPLSEVWHARTPRGEPRTVKVIFGSTRASAEGVQRLVSLDDPSLVPAEILEQSPGKLILASPGGGRALRDLLAECHAQGQPGMPRGRLLGYLQQVAEGLEALTSGHGLFHLCLNPRTLLVEDGNVLMADFGLAQLVWIPSGQSVGGLNTRYSAPELFRGQISSACDQYSLALVYTELLTGTFPPTAAQQHKGERGIPDLGRLPEGDRPLIARALNADPRKRWPNVLELVEALKKAEPSEPAATPATPARVIAPAPAPQAPAGQPGEVLQTRFGTSLSPEVIGQRLDGFRQQWKAKLISADPRHYIFYMQTPRSFWQRWTGQQPGMEIHLAITTPEFVAPAGVQVRTDLRMDLRPQDCSQEQSAEMLKVVGPLLVESLRSHLQSNPHGRREERLVWHHPLQLCSVLPDGSLGPPIECQGKDISLNGIGFYLPGQPPGATVLLHLPQTEQTQRMSVRARVVRAQGCGDGWFEVGAVLLPPQESAAEEQPAG